MEATRFSPALPFEGRRRKSKMAKMQIIIAIIPMVCRTYHKRMACLKYHFDIIALAMEKPSLQFL